MKIWKKVVITIGALIIGVLLTIAGLLNFAAIDICRNEIYVEVLSPDNKYKAIVFQRDCGATTGFSTQISILGASDDLENESGNIYIIDGHPNTLSPEIRWLSNKEIKIEKSLNGSEYKAEQNWGYINKIKISYGAGNN